jgi:hypothetical protein
MNAKPTWWQESALRIAQETKHLDNPAGVHKQFMNMRAEEEKREQDFKTLRSKDERKLSTMNGRMLAVEQQVEELTVEEQTEMGMALHRLKELADWNASPQSLEEERETSAQLATAEEIRYVRALKKVRSLRTDLQKRHGVRGARALSAKLKLTVFALAFQGSSSFKKKPGGKSKAEELDQSLETNLQEFTHYADPRSRSHYRILGFLGILRKRARSRGDKVAPTSKAAAAARSS